MLREGVLWFRAISAISFLLGPCMAPSTYSSKEPVDKECAAVAVASFYIAFQSEILYNIDEKTSEQIF